MPGRVEGVAALLLVGAACSLPTLPDVADPCATWSEPGLYRMEVDDYPRKTLVQVPGTAGPRPLVMALHGYGGSAAEFATEVTRYAEEGSERGVVVAFPQGSGVPGGSGWDAGSCCGTSELGADDVGFLEAVAQALSDRVCTSSVVATGHSNGSMMANRWACETSTPDAVVSSSGPLLLDACSGDPVPVLQVVGLDDPVVPPEGGGGSIGQAPFPSAKDAIDPWRARNGCEGEPTSTVEGIVTTLRWSCDAPTSLITLDGWRHAFPGGQRNRPDGFDLETKVFDMLQTVVEDGTGGDPGSASDSDSDAAGADGSD